MRGEGARPTPRLPGSPRPAADERLSSWLARLAAFYLVPVQDLLAHVGLPGASLAAFEATLPAEADRLAIATGQSRAALETMTFASLIPQARALIAPVRRRICPHCVVEDEAVRRKGEATPWRFWCPVHGTRFQGVGGSGLEAVWPGDILDRLDPLARAGADRLEDWAAGRDHEPTIPDLVELLTTLFRRPGPAPPFCFPRLSLAERRDYAVVLNRPVRRQALLALVPDYDRAAPAFGRELANGLSALARGSLLQCYAMVVGLGRLSADPVGEAAGLLLCCDDEGLRQVQAALRPWPARLRRRIRARTDALRRSSARAPPSAWPAPIGPELGGKPDAWLRLATAVIAAAGPEITGLQGEARMRRLLQLAQAQGPAAGRVSPFSTPPVS